MHVFIWDDIICNFSFFQNLILVRKHVQNTGWKRMWYRKNYSFFSACRPKVYSVDTIPWEIWKNYSNEEKPKCLRKVKKIAIKKLKGVKMHLIRQEFTHKCYIKAITTGKPRYVKYFSINSRCHEVSTYKKGKLGLSGE